MKSKAGEHKDQVVYLAVKSRTSFDNKPKEIKCVMQVKTAKRIIYQSKTIRIIIDGEEVQFVCDRASKQVWLADAFFFDAVHGHNKVVQIPLW